jgi:CBS-domain-containing membrane protein
MLSQKKGVLHMKNLKASDVMVRPVVPAKPHASARDVTLQVLSGLYSGMPVTDEEGRVNRYYYRNRLATGSDGRQGFDKNLG